MQVGVVVQTVAVRYLIKLFMKQSRILMDCLLRQLVMMGEIMMAQLTLIPQLIMVMPQVAGQD